jgi:DNA-binding CsgD family transcriptional regulator/tetratricopeptide (TPR) repeat protein
MPGVDVLVQAREEFERGEWASALDRWSGVDPATLGADDLVRAAAAAHLLGRIRDSTDLYRRAHEERLAAGDVAGAVRGAFHLSMIAGTTGDASAAAGWVARADRLLGELPDDDLEVGYVAFARMFVHLRAGRLEEAAGCADEATDLGRRYGDRALLAMGLGAQGRLSIYGGRVQEGLSLLDESMVEASAGVLPPVTIGHVYCTAVEGGQEVSDIGRVTEWTGLLQDWCAAHPDLVVFTGQCSLHRGQILRARGAWPEALDELDAAIERYERAGAVDAVGQAAYERGEIQRLRGDHEAAEDSYRLSAERGYDPQPGLAELLLDRGESAAATGAVRRVLAEATGGVARSRVLPGAVRVLVTTGDLEGARAAARELEDVAADFGCEALQAEAALAAASVLVAVDDGVGALPYLRKARQLAGRCDLPYSAARCRVGTGLALRAVGDAESARRELDAGRDALSALGARTDLRALDHALAPPPVRPGGLTDREVEVLRLVAAGHGNARIAEELVLSERTVARHLSNIFTKLDVASRTAAAAWAFEHGLVER